MGGKPRKPAQRERAVRLLEHSKYRVVLSRLPNRTPIAAVGKVGARQCEFCSPLVAAAWHAFADEVDRGR